MHLLITCNTRNLYQIKYFFCNKTKIERTIYYTRDRHIKCWIKWHLLFVLEIIMKQLTSISSISYLLGLCWFDSVKNNSIVRSGFEIAENSPTSFSSCIYKIIAYKCGCAFHPKEDKKILVKIIYYTLDLYIEFILISILYEYPTFLDPLYPLQLHIFFKKYGWNADI